MGSEELALISLVPRISPLVCRAAHRCGRVSMSMLLLSNLQDKTSHGSLGGQAEGKAEGQLKGKWVWAARLML